ncbi:MAG: hypothetical protein H6672_12245 [Anaerolineaceae bacterium]|nr:hypothetical protein [Anaerolineaceae bacterium]
MLKSVSVILVNLLICGVLLIAFILNAAIGQIMSMVVAGVIVGAFFTLVSWPISHSQLNPMEKRNWITTLNVVLGIVIFWLAAAWGDGSIFKVHNLEAPDLASIAFGGGIFGLMMGFGLLFDYAMLNQTPLARFGIVASLFGFFMMIVWYFVAEGLLFVISVIAARIIASVFMNRVYADQIKDHLGIVGAVILSLVCIVLPWTAFLLR